MKIILLGYMASGKSTIGKQLAAKLLIPFVDLDNYIEECEGKSIKKIFEEEGEIYFRNKEHEYLKELLNKNEDFVLSLGGGTPCYAGNIDVINSYTNVISVYLKANIRTLVNRLELDRVNRPLVASLTNEQLTEYIAKHLFERQFYYNQAKNVITIDSKSMEDIVDEINSLLS